MKRRISAIDIGTTKVCTIMGVLDSSSGLRVLGIGIASSRGIEKALVANVTQAKESIGQTIEKTEMDNSHRIDWAYVGVMGKHTNSINDEVSVAISKGKQLVRPNNLKRALDLTLDVKARVHRKMSPFIPMGYTPDGHEAKDAIDVNTLWNLLTTRPLKYSLSLSDAFLGADMHNEASLAKSFCKKSRLPVAINETLWHLLGAIRDVTGWLEGGEECAIQN